MSKGKKKKKKGGLPKSTTVMEEYKGAPTILPPLAGSKTQKQQHIVELDLDDDNKSAKRSTRSKSKGKKLLRPTSSKSKERALDETKQLDESMAHLNVGRDEDEQSRAPSKVGKGKKKKRAQTFKRQHSQASMATMHDDNEEADLAAEELVSPKKKKSLKKKKTAKDKSKKFNDDMVQAIN